ncbi:hypothetical protein J6590_102425, partial [Homalodisca vitripennis]
MGKTMGSRPLLRVHYRKLVDDYGMDTISFQPPLPDYLQYCCHQCGHQQKMKVCVLVTSAQGHCVISKPLVCSRLCVFSPPFPPSLPQRSLPGHAPEHGQFCLSEFDERLTCSIRNLSTPHSVLHNYTSLPFVISTLHLSSPCPLYSERHRMLILLVNLAGERWSGVTHPPLSRRLQRECPEQPSPAYTLS